MEINQVANSDKIKSKIENLLAESKFDEAITILHQIQERGENITFQIGESIVNFGEGKDIQIGDRYYVELNDEAIQALIAVIRETCQSPTLPEGIRLDDEWFNRHLHDAAKAAEPRYSPQLTVDVPVARTFEALGRTPRWQSSVRELIKKVSNVAKSWSRGLRASQPDPALSRFPEAGRESAEHLVESLSQVQDGLGRLLGAQSQATLIAELAQVVTEALDLATDCLTIAIEDLEAQHGKGKADSAGFRQFMVEYQLSFPAQHVDSAREIIQVLEWLEQWLDEPQAYLSVASALLLLGPAGIGKTHSICDIALDRHQRGLRSLVFLGEQFSAGEPWVQIRQLLGISATLSRDDLLETFNRIGEGTGYPLIIFIDAVNETRSREVWYTHLAVVIEQVSRYPWLRLCVSCRSTYVEDVIAPNVQIPQVEHTGFAGVEFDACFEFFRFNGLEPPSMPLMQPEFLNPLFLRLVCESLRDAGVTQLPEGMVGISEVVRYLLSSKNAKLARALDYHPREQLVQKALGVLIATMAEQRIGQLFWEEAKELIDSVRPSSQRSSSLFDQMIREGLLREDRDIIRISFERLGEHLLAERYLADITEGFLEAAFAPEGALHFVVADKKSLCEHRGLLEALAIQIPEQYGLELTEVVNSGTFGRELTLAVVESLVWRSSDSLRQQTDVIVREALTHGDTFASAMEALFALSTRTGSPFNSLWFHEFFAFISMPDRDATLCSYLYSTYGQLKGLDRLLRWAMKADLGTISNETAELWVTQLCWFCAASDRRVRDYATKAMVRIMENHPLEWSPVIERFSQVDDEYVIERCLAAVYGSLIRANNNAAIRVAAITIYQIFFENNLLPKNAMVRDYARLILELANHRDELPERIIPEQFRPPYESDWPLDWPDEAFVEQYKDSYQELPKLLLSCMEDDFAVYTVESALREYEDLEMPQALRWIFKHVLDMGYTADRFANFDGHLLYKYGGGRAKPSWAERIGKKYQWIALYRLMAHLADHLEKRRSHWDPPPPTIPELQALAERNIDPTVLFQNTQQVRSLSWWSPINCDFKHESNLSDEEWLDLQDFPASAAMLLVKSPGDLSEWLVLEAYPDWDSRTGNDSEEQYPYRICKMNIRSYLVQRADYEKFWEWVCQQNSSGWLTEGHRLLDGFLGEYPWGIPFTQYFEQYGSAPDQHSEVPYPVIPTVNSINFESGFDAYQDENFNILVPATVFFESDNLRWNSISGYKSDSGLLLFDHPSTLESGPSALLVNKEYLNEFLKENNLVMIWTVFARQYCVQSSFYSSKLGASEQNRVHALVNGEIKSSEEAIQRIGRKRENDNS
jgi:Effector-associated domain 10